MLTLTDIKNQKLETKIIEVEQWGGQLTIKKLSVADRDELAKLYDTDSTEAQQNAALQTIIKGVVNEDGAPMFSAEEHSDLLASQDGEIITNIYKDILDFNGFINKDDDSVKS